MTTKQAIEILKRQRDKLDDPSVPKDEVWTFQTAEYIRQFFGDNSTQFRFIGHWDFRVLHSSGDSSEMVRHLLDQKPKQVKQFLNDCIETLRDTGLYKPPMTNFLQRLDNATIWTIIAFALPSLVAVGFFFGNLKYDKDKLELEQRIKQLQDSLFIIKSPIPTITPTDSATNQKSSDTKTKDSITK